ncbi:succinyl-CoA:3-ketoacid coenzyme A transferase 2, mitochondrial-like isoform X2 [Varroa jacobsoni]|uniref:Succinyl-CoA:3-ketoacid-coenzyme A transferase n=1 Tax=Varroa destructor TaxID=109461 RepID=A0A7M7KUB6_VARDE|nr:succinyl-CoA:3-ketoacid coenzyme A transferase 2, mitochondrial-like isoform X2 [Varroa destructor]XP_022692330.1 succinyl-CoA:3-ketoacid coenzyme A transferase 2, mitochondrial-like isoform X2 [Varroa jacobsoni]
MPPVSQQQIAQASVNDLTLSTAPDPSKRVGIYLSAQEALAGIKDGDTVMVGGFGICGIPENLLKHLASTRLRDLTVVSCTGGMEDAGVGLLIKAGLVKRLISSYIGENKVIFDKFLNGQLEVELVPQGTLAERIRAAGAGIPAFYTPTGYKTMVHEGGMPMKYKDAGKTITMRSQPKETRDFNGRGYVLETAIHADFALVRAYQADTKGNVTFRRTANNYNEVIAKAAKNVVVEVEEIVEAGILEGEHIHLPSIYVNRIFKAQQFKRQIEKLRVSKTASDVTGGPTTKPSARERIILRAAKELKDGMFVNLGIGIPVLAANHSPKGVNICLHGENGIMGLGPYPTSEDVDPDLTNAGKETVTAIPGAAYLSSDESFAIIRGGHLDLTMLGGMQVSENGDIANWIVPGQKITGMGGAMDLVASNSAGTRVVVTMEHNTKDGNAKVVRKCSLPLTGQKCVDRIITEKAVFDVCKTKGLTLIEIARGLTVDELRKCTEASFEVSSNLKCIEDP